MQAEAGHIYTPCQASLVVRRARLRTVPPNSSPPGRVPGQSTSTLPVIRQPGLPPVRRMKLSIYSVGSILLSPPNPINLRGRFPPSPPKGAGERWFSLCNPPEFDTVATPPPCTPEQEGERHDGLEQKTTAAEAPHYAIDTDEDDGENQTGEGKSQEKSRRHGWQPKRPTPIWSKESGSANWYAPAKTHAPASKPTTKMTERKGNGPRKQVCTCIVAWLQSICTSRQGGTSPNRRLRFCLLLLKINIL